MSVVRRSRVEEAVRELAREGYAGPGTKQFPSDPLWAALRRAGTELWLDTGDLEAARPLWTREFSALTTNNTLANQVVQTGLFDGVIRKAGLSLREIAPEAKEEVLVLEAGFVVNCRLALRLVESLGAKVSVELHPAVAHDLEATVRFARRYHAVCPEHFLIKVPLTPAGYCAVVRLQQEGIPINFTLGFSARQNYLAARFSRPSYVNIFLGRLNSVVADNGLGDGKFVGEKATLASQRAVREARQAHPEIATRQIAASIRGGQQVADLAGVEVHTIPPKAAAEFQALRLSPDAIASQLDRDFEIKLKDDADPAECGLDVLWEVDDSFRRFVDEVSRSRDKMTGEELIRASEDHRLGLFHRFTPEETAAISDKGKIPELARWQGEIALDDLMTRSALESFATDQRELDARISSLLR